MTRKEIMNDVAEALWLKPSTKKSSEQIIESIHAEFNNAYKENLSVANEIVKGVEDEKGSRLAKVGFKKTKKGSKHIEFKQNKERALKRANTILHYNQKYPANKFLFESDVENICEKYNLHHGKVSQFTGFVPNKNLKEIESFRIHDEDRRQQDNPSRGLPYFARLDHMIELDLLDKENEKTNNYVESTDYHIVAPLKDFDLEGYHTEGRKIVKDAPPDPVVLFPVKKGYLIMTTWGDEASDPIVQNPNHS